MFTRFHEKFRFTQKLRDGEEGFTLIELMVVVLIIAILIAIAIPAFLGARKRAQRRQAQSNLRNTLTTEKTYFTDNQAYTDNTTQLNTEEPNIKYTNGATSDPATVSVLIGTGGVTEVGMADFSKSKDCYYIFENSAAGTTYGKTETGTQTSCTAPTDVSGVGTAGPW